MAGGWDRGWGEELKNGNKIGNCEDSILVWSSLGQRTPASWWEYWIKTTARLWSIMRNRIKVIGKHFDIYPRFVKRLQDIQKVTLPLN